MFCLGFYVDAFCDNDLANQMEFKHFLKEVRQFYKWKINLSFWNER